MRVLALLFVVVGVSVLTFIHPWSRGHVLGEKSRSEREASVQVVQTKPAAKRIIDSFLADPLPVPASETSGNGKATKKTSAAKMVWVGDSRPQDPKRGILGSYYIDL